LTLVVRGAGVWPRAMREKRVEDAGHFGVGDSASWAAIFMRSDDASRER